MNYRLCYSARPASRILFQTRLIRPQCVYKAGIGSLRALSTESNSSPATFPNSTTQPRQPIEYNGPLADTYQRLKLFSLTSLSLATLMTPLMFIIDSSMPFAGRAVLGFTAMSTSGLSTALIAWLGSTYVTKVRVEDVGVEGAGAGRRVHMTTKTMLLRERVTTVYDPSFLEHAEQYFNKVRLRNQIRVPMAEVEKNGMKLVDGMEETVAETLDEKGNVRGWWEVHWRREGDAGFPLPICTLTPTTAVFSSMGLIEVIANDRTGNKVRVKVDSEDTVEVLKKMIAAQMGTDWEKIVLKKWYTVFKNHITLADYEIHDGQSLEMYYS
ncbi:SubName: Full=Uncharacterized protein {ECO:0000313/EMBL:CCA70537.1} [Serendipita indica DSM 11827]|nr:SubName: Full=Uncharacterized protein {ECO:0000313/EMBL:CCA70537.1} [Serendipita indica DSM 11827]